jgi:hypothetical protein
MSAVAPLEAKAGRSVGGPWRWKWHTEFHKNPEGFCRKRDDVLAREWVRDVCAYFNRVIADGDHLLPAPPAPEPLAVVNPSGCTCAGCRGLKRCRYE